MGGDDEHGLVLDEVALLRLAPLVRLVELRLLCGLHGHESVVGDVGYGKQPHARLGLRLLEVAERVEGVVVSTIRRSKSMSPHEKPQISPRRSPMVSARR